MNDLELVEYAIFHWVFGSNHDLPGIDQSGFLDTNFFNSYARKKNNYKDFAELFGLISKDLCLNDVKSLMLCSGGVDSSLFIIRCKIKSLRQSSIKKSMVYASIYFFFWQ